MAYKSPNNDPMSSSLARGKRLKVARQMAGLTRKSLEQKYRISSSTIHSWEAGEKSNLAERHMSRIIPVLQEEGIFCTADWLLYGIGNSPQLSVVMHDTKEDKSIRPELSEEKNIVQELLIFRRLNKNTIDFIVADNGMEPRFHPGDYVGGCRRKGEDIVDLLGEDCIVETENNEIFLRRLKPGSSDHVYTLICTNLDTAVCIPTVYDQNLLSAAPVIWHRQYDPR